MAFGLGGLGRGLGDFFMKDLPGMAGLRRSDQEKAMVQALQQSAQDYQQYRPEIAQARMQALQQSLSLLDPYNRALEEMYGPGAAPDYSQLLQNPMAGIHERTRGPVQDPAAGVAANIWSQYGGAGLSPEPRRSPVNPDPNYEPTRTRIRGR